VKTFFFFFFGLHFKFGWSFCKPETPLKISRSATELFQMVKQLVDFDEFVANRQIRQCFPPPKFPLRDR